jgi:putative hydrolase
MIDLHTHSIASGHALNTVYELAQHANINGISVLGITEHGPAMKGAPHDEYFWISDKLNELFGVKILLGIEANILNVNGELDLSVDLLKLQKVVSASIHNFTPYCSNSLENNTKSIINAMKNPFVKIITHPYTPGFSVDIKEICKYSVKTNTLLEINNQLFSRISASNINNILENYKTLINECKKNNFPVIFGSDAHIAKDIGNFTDILKYNDILEITDEMIINKNKELLLKYLKNDKCTTTLTHP